MDDLLLREICELSGVTRRAIQGYEKNGLVSSVGKNKMGHLLYDQNALEKIKEIKQYQDCGFSLKEIKGLESISENELSHILENKIQQMRDYSEQLERSIIFLESLIKNL